MFRYVATLWIILLSLGGYASAADLQISGMVFDDLNRNLKLDAGEKGISNVLVSNEMNVVVTDGEGRYQIPVMEGSIIFISQPAGYSVPLNSRNLPQFYYIHKPEGSPVLAYPGIAPTGPLPASLNFPLFRSSVQDTFNLIVFSDPQPENRREIDYIRDDVVSELVGTSAAGVIVLGDIMFNDLSLYEPYIEVIAQMGIPVFHVPGNHDMNFDVKDDVYALETYKSHFGPAYYGFEYGKVHFIVLDDVDYLGRDAEGRTHYQGRLGEKQLQWLENYLPHIPSDRLIVLNMHIPFTVHGSTHPAVQVADREALFALLNNRRHLLALAGHMHMIDHQFLVEETGWQGEQPLPQIICGAVSGSWWSGPPDIRGIPVADQRDGAPNGYHIFTFRGNAFTEFYKPASFSPDFQIRISQPAGTISQSSLKKSLDIIVNVFDGNEKSVVECQIDDQPVHPMNQTASVDPFSENFHKQYREAIKSWIEPEKTLHLWKSPLPSDLKPGLHRIMVTVTNPWGKRFQAARIFRIEQGS